MYDIPAVLQSALISVVFKQLYCPHLYETVTGRCECLFFCYTIHFLQNVLEEL